MLQSTIKGAEDRVVREKERLVNAGINPIQAAHEAKELIVMPPGEEIPVPEEDPAPACQPDMPPAR